MHTQPAGNRYVLLDAVRGFAIVWIVVFHLLNQHLASYPEALAFFIKSGYLGVPIFFLVSGYAVSTSAARVLAGTQSPYQFLANRLSRIYIPLFYSLVFAGFMIPAATWILYSLSGYSTEGLFFDYSIPEWLGLFTLLKIFAPVAGDLNRSFLPINGVLWFVAVLVQMYFAIFLALLIKRFYFVILGAITFLWVGSVLIGSAADAYLPRGLFLPSWGPFAAGVGLYYSLRLGGFWLRLLLWSVSVFALFFVFNECTFFLFVWMSLWVAYRYDGAFSSFKPVRFFVFLGTFSYSLYLLHIPFDDLITTVVGFISPFPEPWTDLFLIVPVITLVSWFWSRCFEVQPGLWMSFLKRGAEWWFPGGSSK